MHVGPHTGISKREKALVAQGVAAELETWRLTILVRVAMEAFDANA
jgi:hypothetical protein